MKELQRRDDLTKPPGLPAISQKQLDENIVKEAGRPFVRRPTGTTGSPAC
jgi:hypothetical protein